MVMPESVGVSISVAISERHEGSPIRQWCLVRYSSIYRRLVLGNLTVPMMMSENLVLSISIVISERLKGLPVR